MSRILIVDGIKEEGKEISDILEKEGYEVVVAMGYKEGFRISEKERFDLVLVDIHASEKDGLEFVKGLKNRYPGIGVLIIDTSVETDSVMKALRVGAFNFVERPIRYKELLWAVEKCLERMRLEMKLNEANSLLDAVLSGLGEGVVVIDRDLKIDATNKAFLDRVGLKKEDIKGRHCYEVSHRHEACCKDFGEECPVLETFRTGGHAKVVHRHYDSEGNLLWVEVNSYPMRDEKGEVIRAVETVMDITERVRLEEETKKRVKELEDFYEMAVGRELKMIELKKEIERLREELSRYKK